MEELIQMAKKGDKDAYTQIILNIKQDLYKIAKTRLLSEVDIEDAIQETMIELYKSIKKLKDPQKFKKWIITILINKCNRLYRKRYKQDVTIENIKLQEEKNAHDKIDSDLNFYSLLKGLKYEEKIVIILFYMEDYSIKEISKILKINENTVKSRLFRGKQRIKLFLEGNDNG